MIAVALVLAGGVWAAPVQPSVEWLRLYPLAPYRETWAVTVEVKNLAKDLPRVMQAIEKRGGRLSVPLQNSAASPTGGLQQLMYRLTEKSASSALKELKRIGLLAPPIVRPTGERAPLSEIKRKIDELSRDKSEHAAELARMPAVSGLVDAVLSHLVTAKAVAEKSIVSHNRT